MNKWVNQKDFFVWAGIDIDSPGRLWIGTAPAGIIIYDPDHHSARLLFPNDSAQQQNISDANVYLYCDRNGIVWSGAWERRGIYEITPFSPAVTNIFDPQNRNIQCFSQKRSAWITGR